MIKRITSSVLALCLTLTLLLAGVWAASPTSGQWADLSWSYDSAARTLTISGAGAMPDVPTINASPFRRCDWYSNGVSHIEISFGVTSIGMNAFEGCRGLQSIAIPDSVTSIGSTAFENSSLTSVTLPSSLTSLGSSTFSGCDYLTEIHVAPAAKAMLQTAGWCLLRI